jgi:hypothetical protein
MPCTHFALLTIFDKLFRVTNERLIMKTLKEKQTIKNAAEILLSNFFSFTCPECDKVFTEAEEWAYGHDCE